MNASVKNKLSLYKITSNITKNPYLILKQVNKLFTKYIRTTIFGQIVSIILEEIKQLRPE
jgi:hypothetical protein